MGDQIKKTERSEEERRRIRRQQLRKKRQREARIKRAILAGVLLLLVLLIAAGISAIVGKKNKPEKKEEAVGYSGEILHLSFEPLIADTGRAFQREDAAALAEVNRTQITVEEFKKILQQLYKQDYVLVRMKDFVEQGKAKDGSVSFSQKKPVLPEGKKPLIISQQNVNSYFDTLKRGYASKVVLDAKGAPVNELLCADGTSVWGSYDLISCLNEFVEQHPDFSYKNARGILGVTGYQGILGYRTDELLAKSKEEGNPYAEYGNFEVENEIEQCREVVNALKAQGWEFASYSYSKTSYGADLEIIQKDAELWESRVETIIGKTEHLIFPYGTDIASRRMYDEKNERFQYLKEKGFHYFYGEDEQSSWLQVGPDYVRQMRIPVSGELLYRQTKGEKTALSEILKAETIYDSSRPAMNPPEEAQETDS